MATDAVTAERPETTSPVSPRPEPPSEPRRRERSAEEIITAARTAPPRSRWAWLLCFGTGFLFWASFPPLDFGPLGFVALVPLLMLVRLEQRPRWTYRAAYLAGTVSFLACWQWLRLGDVSMHVPWLALCLYTGLYVPVFLWLCRVAVLRFRVPLVVAGPVFWTGFELARAHVITGPAWYYLGHTQYQWLEFIQISDLVGAYGVSFVIVASSAVLAMLVPVRWYERTRLVPTDVDANFAVRSASPREQWIAVGSVVLLFAATLVYGHVRRGQATWADAEAAPGPRMALIQANFTAEARAYSDEEVVQIRRTHYGLTGKAVKHQPDVIVWPEAMFPDPPVKDVDPNLDDARIAELTGAGSERWWRGPDAKPILEDISKQANAGMIVGVTAHQIDDEGAVHFNSAAFLHPSLGYRGRYDKIHRVPYGEYVPMREWLGFLTELSPYGFDEGIARGAGPRVFEYGSHRYCPVICFESTVPHLVRGMVDATRDEDGKPVDVLVTISNDGWFHGASGLDQHLITSAFRCVETRTPMACAVNTGISAFIDGDGAIVEPDVFIDADGRDRGFRNEHGVPNRQLDAVLVHDVPLDGRTSLYVRYGDWFAMSCLAATLFVAILGLIPRRRRSAQPA